MILYKYIENDTINICNNIDTNEFNLLINLIEKYNIKINVCNLINCNNFTNLLSNNIVIQNYQLKYLSNELFLTPEFGITKNFGGGFIFQSILNNEPIILKYFFIDKINKNNINEPGNAFFISEYFSNNKIIDNYVKIYKLFNCYNYIDKLNELHPLKIAFNSEKLTNKDVNLMVIEKVLGDIGKYIEANKTNDILDKIENIFFQVIYSLVIFYNSFNGFYHGDLHLGNILYSIEEKEYKTYKINDNIIKIKTYNICPLIWDFATSYIGTIHENLDNNDFMNKYFYYLKSLEYNKLDNRIIDLNFIKDIKYLISKIMVKDKIQSIVNLEDYINKNPDIKPNNILFRFISYLQIESSHKIIDEEEYNDVVDYNFN